MKERGGREPEVGGSSPPSGLHFLGQYAVASVRPSPPVRGPVVSGPYTEMLTRRLRARRRGALP